MLRFRFSTLSSILHQTDVCFPQGDFIVYKRISVCRDGHPYFYIINIIYIDLIKIYIVLTVFDLIFHFI